MKNRTIIILCGLFIILIFGAGILDKYYNERLIIIENNKELEILKLKLLEQSKRNSVYEIN